MAEKYDEDKVIKLLKQLPPMEDQQDKEELFRKVSDKINKEDKGRQKGKQTFRRAAPSLGVAALVLFFSFLVFQLFQDSRSSLTGQMEFSTNGSEEAAVTEEMAPAEESIEESIEESSEAADGEQSAASVEEVEPAFFYPSQEKVLFPEADERVFTVVLQGPEQRYLIPVSLVFPDGGLSEEVHYSQLENYLNEEEWELELFPLDNWVFETVPEEGQVIAAVPASSGWPEKEALQEKWKTVLAFMFAPEQIKEVLFYPKGMDSERSGEPIERFMLPNLAKYAYKYARTAFGELLVPVPLEEKATVEQAIAEMKENETDNSVSASIPETVEVSAEVTNETLAVQLEGETVIGNNLATQRMLEAILMTAKSFGLEEVLFDLPVSRVGPYQLEEPVEVPLAANPFYLE